MKILCALLRFPTIRFWCALVCVLLFGSGLSGGKSDVLAANEAVTKSRHELGSPSASEGGGTIVLGGIFDLTNGPGGLWGRGEQDGATLAVEDFNAKSKGLQAAFTSEDSGYDNAKSVSAFTKLTSLNRVAGIIGPTWEPFDAVMPICERKKVLCLSPSLGHAGFNAPSVRYSFSLWFDNREYARAHMARLQDSKYAKVAIVSAMTSYYELVHDEFQNMLGSRVVASERVSPTAADMRALALKVPKNVDAVVVLLLGGGMAEEFFKRWVELRSDRPVIFTDDAILYYSEGMHPPALGFKVFYSEPDTGPFDSENFSRRYQKRFGTVPQAPSAAIAYDAATLLLSCLAKNSASTEKTRECLAATEGFKGMSGTLSFAGGHMLKERRMKSTEFLAGTKF
jgi:branched-chain amino acid transport system substrate-binding protein